MSSTFGGFSEEDLQRIKLGETRTKSDSETKVETGKKIDRIGVKTKRSTPPYKLPILQKQPTDDDAIDSINFDKCKLSIKTPTSPNADVINNNDDDDNMNKSQVNGENYITDYDSESQESVIESFDYENYNIESRKGSFVAPDIVIAAENFNEDELAAHKVKLEELQMKQKIMEEQNKKRKEMLAKALADRTKQTEEEVIKLEKIKKELQVLDGKFSQDVAVLRKKIDQACLSYAEAEKHYLKIEKDFLQAKIQLQKEREKKELLTEHLCALITHNETRKAQKLETLMLELASSKTIEKPVIVDTDEEDHKRVIVDGVDERTGKIVELPS